MTPNGNTPWITGNGWQLIFPEGFVINGSVYHFPTSQNGETVYPGTGEWTTDGNVLRHKRTYTNPGIQIETTVASLADGIELTLAVRNLSGFDWDASSYANVCFKPPADLLDPSYGAVTFINKAGSFPTLGSQISVPQTGQYAGQFEMFVNNPSAAPYTVDGPQLIRRSPNSLENWCGVSWHNAARVGGNFNQGSCMHSNPQIGPLANGAARSIKGRIVIGSTSLNDTVSKLATV